MGDSKTGLSIFWPDGGIDTGPILLQKEIDIGPEDTTGSLYFNQLFPMGVDAILESIALIKEKNAPKIIQNEAEATYEPPCDDSVAGIDWEKPAQELYNLVRGCDPQPGAYMMHQEEKLRFYGVKLIQKPSEKAPGTILNIDDQGIHTAVSGGELLIGKVKLGPGKKMPASEFASEQGLKVGDKLGT
jgi:methionyl-tRNA formyltransferase